MRIHAIQTGTVRVKERQRAGRGAGVLRFVNTLRDAEWTDPLPILCWVIEHPEGLIVVDTGETARATAPGYFPRWHPYYRFGVRFEVGAEEEIGPRLRTLGIAPDDVRWVILTHLHTDHAGGLHHFRESEILVSEEEYRAARGVPGKIRGYLPHHWPSWFEPRLVDFPSGPLGPFAASHALTRAGDVHLVPTPGHSSGHLSVILADGDLHVLLAGDTSYTEQHLVDEVVDGVSSLGGGEQAALATIRRIETYAHETPLVYLPSHDPESTDRLSARRPLVEPAVAATASDPVASDT